MSDYFYDLPADRIAQEPPAERSASRMLVLDRAGKCWQDRMFRELPQYLKPGDCLVLNDSKVFPSRLYGHRAGLHSLPLGKNNPKRRENLTGAVEVFLLRPVAADARTWEALVRPGRKMRTGERIRFESGLGKAGETARPTTKDLQVGWLGGPGLEAEIIGRGEYGERTLRFDFAGDIYKVLDAIGHMPLPPYIKRPDTVRDRERYQTVYARQTGSVAAPTAGLHFTPEILQACREGGAETAYVTLHVGLGTFQPVRGEKLHSERFEVPEETRAKIGAAGRTIAVGTTSVRAVESMLQGKNGETDLFIRPGFDFRGTDAMLTNFHLPDSSLLMLVCAFAGRELVLDAYRHAVESGYRFYSYGDCMLIL